MTDNKTVRVKSAPGLKWFKRNNSSFEARWRCRADIVEKGYRIKSVKLWSGQGNPTLEEWDFIVDTCTQLQQEMLVWNRGGLPESFDGTFDGTIAGLIRCYHTDPDSAYRKKPGRGGLRYPSRVHYDVMMGMIEKEFGTEEVAKIKGRTVQRWYDDWCEKTGISTAHTKVKMLRILLGFGASLLEDPDCMRLKAALREMKFAMAKPRTQVLNAQQAIAIRNMAHEMGRPSIALAQAFQFECMFRQKDCIGCWEPISEPGVSDVFDGTGLKWLRGIRWEEIDQNLMLTHVTSKKDKEIKINLRNAPMVMEELGRFKELPKSGPIVVSEFDDLPWEAIEFRRWWRKLADLCGIPKSIRNMDSRAGAISEAIASGASLEHVRHGATHSDIQMTQRYDRSADEAIAKVQKLRSEGRNKPRTE